jgi:hypothetical protein
MKFDDFSAAMAEATENGSELLIECIRNGISRVSGSMTWLTEGPNFRFAVMPDEAE